MTTPEDDDEWPPIENRAVASNRYLVAFGQITLAYNVLESIMEQIFERCAPLDPKPAKTLFHSLNNRERIDLLASFVRKNEKDAAFRDAIEHCVKCYNICTDNRNILMHVIALDVNETTAKWTKRASQKPDRIIEFHAPLGDLRLVADEIAETFRYAWSIHLLLWHRDYPEQDRLQLYRTLSLPNKPPKPRKLTPYQPEADRKGDPPQPQSSGR
jgi:hypothetical protein